MSKDSFSRYKKGELCHKYMENRLANLISQPSATTTTTTTTTRSKKGGNS